MHPPLRTRSRRWAIISKTQHISRPTSSRSARQKGPLQVEASTFHGREPNENRWNIDSGKPDSFATRLTIAPYRNLTTQISTGRMNNPETVDANLDIVRTTASIHHQLEFGSGHVSSSLMWGRNKILKNGSRRIFNAYGFEMTTQFLRRNWIWTRIENVDRDRTLLPVARAPVSCLLCGILGFGDAAADHRVLGPGEYRSSSRKIRSAVCKRTRWDMNASCRLRRG